MLSIYQMVLPFPLRAQGIRILQDAKCLSAAIMHSQLMKELALAGSGLTMTELILYTTGLKCGQKTQKE